MIQRKIPLTESRGLAAFQSAHPEARVVGDYLVADVKRRVTMPQEWLETLIYIYTIRKAVLLVAQVSFAGTVFDI